MKGTCGGLSWFALHCPCKFYVYVSFYLLVVCVHDAFFRYRMLSLSAPEDQKALVFAGVFVLVWIGAAIITLNAQLLGGAM